ncbi:MAG: 2-oxoacid:acceptor oxidoreductase subunit alpha [Rhizomicrobium sp.]
MSGISAINNFVVKFANINGTGSATANEIFARAAMRMGVPIASRNIFPSNIQGLPTWYEVRITEDGWRGRRGGVDLMVAVNPQTFDKDVAEIDKNGYLLYDSTKPVAADRLRPDIHVLPVPLTEICNAADFDPRKRLMLKNIIYIGALTFLLDMELDAVEWLVAEQFEGKPALSAPNIAALNAGYGYAEKHLKNRCGLKIHRADKLGKQIFIGGNDAAGLGCVWGGATVCAWYPITPSTSLVESFAKHCRRFRTDKETEKKNYAIVQAEDELASIGMVIGAGWNGTRSFTATSGPGLSLMQEFLSFAYYAEIPGVLFDVQRGGPSTGMPTRTQQSDLLMAAYAGHGDTKHVLLFPEDPGESFAFAADAFDLAERLQTPVMVMMDLDIGMNDWLCDPLKWDKDRRYDRGKVMSAEDLESGKLFARYKDVDGDGIPWRTLPGTHAELGAYFTRGTSHDAFARYSEDGTIYVANMQRLLDKLETAKKIAPQPILHTAPKPASDGVIYFGSTSAAMDEALDALEERDLHLDALRIRAFPFAQSVPDFIAAHQRVFVIEQNRDAQMRQLIMAECNIDPAKLVAIRHFDGTPITERFITKAIAGYCQPNGKTPDGKSLEGKSGVSA